MKNTIHFNYKVCIEGANDFGNFYVIVSNNKDAFKQVEEEAIEKYKDYYVKFNHVGKTIKLTSK